MIEKIVIATHNPAKKEKYTLIFNEICDEVLSLSDLGIKEKPEESGNTAEENAEIKARFYLAQTGLPTFSEDEALYVDFLPKDQQPGVHVRRINGKDEVNDNQLISHWEKLIAKVPVEKRTGKWHIAYSIALPKRGVRTVAVEYPIQFFSPTSHIRIPGWPMSSLEGDAIAGKPFSEFTEKDNELVDQKTTELIKEKLQELLKDEFK